MDVSAELDGYWADTGASTPVGPPESVTPVARRLVEAARAAHADAMNAARAGRPIGRIGRAVERQSAISPVVLVAGATRTAKKTVSAGSGARR